MNNQYFTRKINTTPIPAIGKFLIFIVMMAVAILSPHSELFAAARSSTNYQIDGDTVTGSGGGRSSSTQYTMQSQVGEIAAGASESAIFKGN